MRLLGAATLSVLTACGDAGYYGGDFGATQGGVQDMSLARELIATGTVPPPEAFVVEGMFSEHDLGLTGEPCSTLLCLRTGVGIAPDHEGVPSAWLQVGLSSTINPETYERPSISIIATVDVSGSMGWNYSDDAEYPSSAALAKRLLRELAGQLRADDRIAIVTYGSRVRTALDLTAGDNQNSINRAIDRLDSGGSTNMEAGMERAYDEARDALGAADNTRVIVFTDARPNVGATSGSEFETMAANGAADGVGLTVLGLGLGLGQDVTLAMSHLRGGNAFSFSTHEHVDTFMADDWPWFTAPIAYDLSLHVGATSGYSVAQSYGFPESADQEPGEVGMSVSTVFLSKKKGALLARIQQADPGRIGKFYAVANLRYTTPEGALVTVDLDAPYGGEELDGLGQYFEQPSVAKSTALALLVSGMHEAATSYSANQQSAIDHMQVVYNRFASDIAALDDAAVNVELQLAEELLRLMQEGAGQGDYYPY